MASKKFNHSGRDAWGQSHGNAAGKGDAARHKFDQQFRENYDAIKWGPKFKGRFRKTYRAAAVTFTDLAEIPPLFSGEADR
jgi:hypothetical protein